MQHTRQRTANKGKDMQIHEQKDKPMQIYVIWQRKECGPMQMNAKRAKNGNTKQINSKQSKGKPMQIMAANGK